MQSKIEPLYKSKDKITFGWTPEPVAGVTGYKIYVSLIPDYSTMTLIASVSPTPSAMAQDLGKVSKEITIESVRTALSIPTTSDFSNLLLSFTITYLDSAGNESSILESILVDVPPPGVLPKTMKDDPSINRHGYVFSDSLQKWTKSMGSAKGATVVDTSGFYKVNTITEKVYDGTNLSSEKVYLSDQTASGAPAKLTTYEYTGGNVTKIIITDSTV